MLYYIARLGFHFDEFPISVSAMILICGTFFILNQIFFKISEEKEKVLIQKLFTLSLSM